MNEDLSENVEKKEFIIDDITIELQQKKYCIVQFTATTKDKTAKESRKETIRKISKEVSIPGFRKGHAPATIIEERYKDALEEEWRKTFADLIFNKLIKVTNIRLFHSSARVNFKVNSLTKEGGTAYFQFESEPQIPEINISQFTIKDIDKEIIEVDEKQVEEAIKNIKMFFAKWEQVKDRQAQYGDFVTLDIDDIDQDQLVHAFSDYKLEIAEGKMASWMKELVLGKNVGESVEGISKADEDDSEDVKKDFKPKKVKIYIKEIESVQLPSSDELAINMGLKTTDHMLSTIKKMLQKQHKENNQINLRDSISEQMLENIVFDIPYSMLEKEANHRMNTLIHQEEFKKQWESEMSDDEKENKKSEIKSISEKAIKLFYICQKIIKDNKITISEKNIIPSCGNMLDAIFADKQRLNFKNLSEEEQHLEMSKYMIETAEDCLISKIKGV